MLAFDFVVQSDQGLTGQMLSMRDQSFAWLAAQAAAGTQTFTVDTVNRERLLQARRGRMAHCRGQRTRCRCS